MLLATTTRAVRGCFALLCLLVVHSLFAQHSPAPVAQLVEEARQQRTVFEPLDLFTPTPARMAPTFPGVLTDAVVLDFDFPSDRTTAAELPDAIQLSLPTGQRGQLTLDLVRVEVLTDDFTLLTSESNNRPVEYTPGAHYRGTVAGDPHSVAAISIFDGEVSGLIGTPETGNLILGKIQNQTRGRQQHILYHETDLIPTNDYECGTEDSPMTHEDLQLMQQIANGTYQNNRNSSNCVRVYLELENNLVSEKGGATGATNFITGVWNMVATLYQNESISTQISQIYTWTTPDNYPTSSTSAALNAFRAARPNYNGDLAHLISRGAPSNGGIAWVNALCTSYGYAYSWISSSYQNVPTYSWTVNVLTHEMGHNLGSPHTHACVWNGNNTPIDGCGPQYGANEGCTGPIPNKGTIMSYCHLLSNVGIDLNLGFGQQPGDLVRARVAQAGCLTSCGGGGGGGGGNCHTANISKSDVGCAGGNDGSATASAFGGSGPFTFQWNTGASSATINNLTAGTYSVTVSGANNCSATASVTIAQPAGMNLNLNAADAAGGNNGSASVTVSGGTAPYTYQWSNGGTGSNISGLAPGTYSVVVTDVNGCSQSGSVVVSDATAGCSGSVVRLNLQFDNFPGDISWNLKNASGATVASGANYTANFGTVTQDFCLADGCYTFTILDSYGDGLCPNYNGNTPGTYSLVDLSTNTTLAGNCAFGSSENTNFCLGSADPDLSLSVGSSAVSCAGGNDGQATVIAAGGNGVYTYAWNNGSTTATTTGLTAGVYSVTVVSGTQTETATVSVQQPLPLDATASGTSTSNGANNGSATANATGGTPGYTYAWSNGASNKTIYNLAPGTYTVTVADASGCTDVASVTVPSSTPTLNLSMNATSVDCFGNATGTATVSATGGSGVYNYLWNTGATTNALTGLTAGTYAVTVTSGNQTKTSSIVVTQPALLSVTATGSNTTNGTNNGTATANVTGGTAPYGYQWSNGSTAKNLFALAPGLYTVTVVDGNGCSATTQVAIQQSAPALTLATGANGVSCFGGSDGQATVIATGGTGTYTYQWSNGGTTATLIDLTAGSYAVTVTSGSATQSALVIVGQPGPLTVNINATDASNGSNGVAAANAVGGTPPYTYAWNNGSTSAYNAGLTAGIYTVTVTDANACTTVRQTTIEDTTPGLNLNVQTKDVSCYGGDDGYALAVVTGGNGSYYFQWSTGSSTSSTSGLAAGAYSVTVTSGNFTKTSSFFVEQPDSLTLNLTATDELHGDSTGTIAVTAAGGTAPYDFAWDHGAFGSDLTELKAGVYTVTLSDANGCARIDSVVVGNDTLTCIQNRVELSLQLDSFPQDIFWSLTNEAGDTLLVSAAYDSTHINRTVRDTFCLADGCYAFNLVDTSNNGLCTVVETAAFGGFQLTWLVDGTPTTLNERDCAIGSGETVAFCVQQFEEPDFKYEYGYATEVGDDWQTISLDYHYKRPVVVATVVNPNIGLDPVVTRVRHAEGTSFDLRVQRPSGETADTYRVYWFVVEEGVYTEAEHGVNMEAVRVTSEQTFGYQNWNVNEYLARDYQQDYVQPVVVGQVMTQNDTRWSVFWASREISRTFPADQDGFQVARHAGEDANLDRAAETIGYVVTEAGTWILPDGTTMVTDLTNDKVRGMQTNAKGYRFDLKDIAIDGVVLSSAAMDDGNGGWPVLKGIPNGDRMYLAIDEDQLQDAERYHGTEQVAYVAFGPSLGNSVASGTPATETDDYLRVYPNPVRGVLTVEFDFAEGERVQFVVTDLTGRPVLPATVRTASGGLERFSVDVYRFPAGLYFLDVISEYGRQSRKFTVLD